MDSFLDLVRVDHERNSIFSAEFVALAAKALDCAFRVLDASLANQPPRGLRSEAHGYKDRNRPNPLDLEDGVVSIKALLKNIMPFQNS